MLTTLFPHPKPVIGMIHVGALPGTPANTLSMRELIELAVREPRIYREGGVDGIGIENINDVLYLRGGVGPEIVAAMALLGQAVKAESHLPVGVQVLAGAHVFPGTARDLATFAYAKVGQIRQVCLCKNRPG